MPETYAVLSTDDDYLVLKALEADGKAALVGERFLDGGVVEAVFTVGARRNPLIRVSPRFFQTALKDYEEWRLKWWREVVQNSVDAGAANVRLDAIENEDGTWTVSCDDDGSGMDLDLFLAKFMILGESGKEHEATVGGFGKAKELILGPWIEWAVWSRGYVARGQSFDEEKRVVDSAPWRSGTKVSVVMPADQHTDITNAMGYLQRCSTSGVRYYLNGERFEERVLAGKKVKSLACGTLYRNKSKQWGAVLVRARGLYTFSLRTSLDAKYGTLVVEIEGDTRELLTANRDGFRDWRHDSEIRHFIEEIVSEGEQALKEKEGLITEVWEGTGQITTEQGLTDVLDALGPLPAIPPGEELAVGESALNDVCEALAGLVEVLGRTQGNLTLTPATPEIAHEIVTYKRLLGASDAEALAQQLAWTPDFMVHNEVRGLHVPKKFTPVGMTSRIAALAKVWAEACRLVFIKLGARAEYGVGFIFSENALAAYMNHKGRHWLLLNPLRTVAPLRDRQIPADHMLVKSSREDMKELFARATHEASHMDSGYTRHDSDFSAALTHNFAFCMDAFPTMMKITRAVKAVGEDRPEKPQRRASSGIVTVSVSRSDTVLDLDDVPVEVRKAASLLVGEDLSGVGFVMINFRTYDDLDDFFIQAGVTLGDKEGLSRGRMLDLKLPFDLAVDLFALGRGYYTGDVLVDAEHDSVEDAVLWLPMIRVGDPSRTAYAIARLSSAGYDPGSSFAARRGSTAYDRLRQYLGSSGGGELLLRAADFNVVLLGSEAIS